MLFRLISFALLVSMISPVTAQQSMSAGSGAITATIPSGLAEAIRDRTDRLREGQTHIVRGERIIAGNLVSQYYEAQQFHSDWSDATRYAQLLAALEDLRLDGLDPDDYHLAVLRSFNADTERGRVLTMDEQADREVLAMDAMLLAVHHLYHGKVHPQRLSSEWNFSERPVNGADPLGQLAAAIDSGRIRESFDAARPQHPWYARGRERLAEYRRIAAAGGWPTVPDGPVLKPGMSDARVPVLRQRLSITRDYSSGTTGAAASADAAADELYDIALEAAVKGFQERHGLGADGVIGPGTRNALNVPVQARIDQIRVNLERARWTLHEIKGEFVLVDVAGFYVSYFNNDEPVWTSRVVVGRQGRETPIFKSKITYVVLNPTWTIPSGILAKDKLPILQRDAGALKRSNIRVLDAAGREVDPHAVNWHQYSASRLPPYQFRQDPGADNALGRVKIMFPNPHSVYLHDTPSKNLFDEPTRLFSSGCIRVQNALELAERVLGEPARWNQTTLQAAIATGATQTINLPRPLPVLILYWTAQPRPDGQIIFRADVYGRDAATLQALDSDFALPAAPIR
jgi:murein L,D-transpeptidase YcbB/YkuD